MTDIDSSTYDHLTMDRLPTEALDPRNGMSPPDSKPKDKGKSRAFNLGGLSFGSPSSTPPNNNSVEHDPQTNSYLLPLSSSAFGIDTTPSSSASSIKSPPRPPARSPLRQSQMPSPRPKTIEPPPLPSEAGSGEPSRPIPRQGKGNLDATAKAKRKEAYKSGMSFVSLYELYSEEVPPVPVPVPPLPPLDRSKLDGDPNLARRARSGSTASLGPTRERKNSQHGIAPIPNHTRTRSGSTTASAGHVSRPSRDTTITGVLANEPLRLANATMSASILLVPATAPLPIIEGGSSKSKRQHILFEILETERIYSSDMALVRGVHLPLALGMKVEFGPMGTTTGSARSSGAEAAQGEASRISGISTNTTSSQSGSSGYPVSASTGYTLANEPPMSVEDAKVIFANLDELAEFSDRFTELIELALGSEIEGGTGHDKIGNLFLQMLPIMTPIYETYITKHSASISRLTSLTTESPTPAMLSYIENTKAIASTHSNSWDLNSLLIKPIQRFLKYPLLLESLAASTPDEHPDKPDLIRAKTAMVDASRLVNEQTQKVEICRTILQRKPLRGLSAVFATNTPNSQQLKVKGSKSVFAVTKSKDPAVSGSAPETPPTITPFDANFDPIQLENRLVEHAGGGAGGLEALIKHLQGFETLIPQYVRDIVSWVRTVRESLDRLEKWAAGFERVISLDEASGIEALDAFRGVIKERLGQILTGLEIAIKQTLAPTLAKIQESMKGPTLLLNTAASLRTVHNQLMNTPYTNKNNRPSPQVVEGSKTYLALMQQLRTDLPVYVRHLDRMFAYVILQVAKWQERWYREVAQAWADLWAALEVGPGSRREYRARRHRELSGKKAQNKNHPEQAETTSQQRGAYGCGGDETAAIWWNRWEEVDNAIRSLGVPSGAALQGVRSLQGLIKSAASTVAVPTQYGGPYGSPFSSNIMYEGIEEETRDDRHLPGPIPSASPPAEPRRARPARPPLRPNLNIESTNSYRQSISSPIQSHAINTFLPAVSPGVERRERPVKGRDVSFPSAGSTRLSNGSSDYGSSLRPSPREYEPSSSQRIRTKSHEREFGVKIPDAAEQDSMANRSRTVPRGTSFRKRLSESMWLGESTSKDAGLDIDPEELEAAIATTHAREEREAALSSLGPREQSQQATNGSLQRKPSSSMSINALRKRKPSNATETGVNLERVPRPGGVNRPRQVSEYGRSLNLTPIDLAGVSLFSDDAPILFTCTAVASFHSQGLRYAGLPFLELEIGDIINIVKDAGRPSQHPELQPVVSDGVDTLFIGKRLPDGSESTEFGWLWASFVMPLGM